MSGHKLGIMRLWAKAPKTSREAVLRRRLFGAALLAAVLLPADVQAQNKSSITNHGIGTESCGKFLEYLRTDQTATAVVRTWILGFVSAYNWFPSATGDVFNGLDNVVIFALVERECQSDPRTSIAYAAAKAILTEEAAAMTARRGRTGG